MKPGEGLGKEPETKSSANTGRGTDGEEAVRVGNWAEAQQV